MNPSAPISALKRVLHVLDELGKDLGEGRNLGRHFTPPQI